MELENFRCVMRFRVAFHDVDMLQHVNNAAYVVWAESVRCQYLAEVLEEPLDGMSSVILARQEFVYERPLEYREQVAVGCRVSRLGRRSFDFAYEMWSETHNYRSAYGTSAMVAYDYGSKSSISIPERWRERIAIYEPRLPEGALGAPLP